MEFLILGPLEVRDGGRIVRLGGAKQRAALAMLLLHRNHVVSRDRLVDGLWGDSPPPSAAHTLDTYVSLLRKALHHEDEDRLLTRSPGYLLRVHDGELDLDRFEVMLGQARRALSSRDPDATAEALRAGVALFRGAPLADLADMPFVRSEAARLDDMRLAALEQLNDADLAMGRHLELVGDLEQLVERYPLRERFWAQWMLALYRAGRQAEALTVFDRVRRELVEELGVEPGPPLQELHHRILRHDPALDSTQHWGALDVASSRDARSVVQGAAGGRGPPRSRSHRRRRRLLTAAAVTVGAGLVAIVISVAARSGTTAVTANFSPGMAIVDAKTGGRRAVVSPSNLHLGNFTYVDGHFWAAGSDPEGFVEINPASGRVVRRISPTIDVGAYAINGSDLWELGATALAKIDVRIGREVDRYRLPSDPAWPGGQTGIAIADGSVWVTRAGLNEVLRIDPDTGHVLRRYPGVAGPSAIAVSGGTAWTVSHFSDVTVVDLVTGHVAGVAIPAGALHYVVTGGGYGWVSDEVKGVVYKIDRAGTLVATYHTGEGASPLAYADGEVWVANGDVGTVTRIVAITGATRRIAFHHPTQNVAAGDGRVLVGIGSGPPYEARIDSLPGRVAKLLVQPYQLAGNDPALDSTWLAFEVEYATCAKLVNYPDAAGTDGTRLRPEIATSMPALSADRRTYTFNIRPGYRFSPPSNQPVTAQTFRSSIERALSPRMESDAPGPRYISDIAGENAYRTGNAAHISGLNVRDNTLTIRLVKPSADFLQRLALPFFCPLPIGTFTGIKDVGASVKLPNDRYTVPSAGPYYVADANTGEYLILKPNPNYTGPRPRRLDAIALREGIDPGQAAQRVENGSWDGIIHLYDPLLDPTDAIAHTWGPNSTAAKSGNQRYYPVPMPGLATLAFNAGRHPFSDPTVRRAAALALNRSHLTGSRLIVNNIGEFSIAQATSAQLLPPSQPGSRTGEDPYPLHTSNLAKAQTLMRGRRFTARLAVTGNCGTCQQWARAIQHQLAPIGITVDITDVPDAQAAVRNKPTTFDLFEADAGQDFPDPAAFLTTLFRRDVPPTWLPAGVRSQLANLQSLAGQQRIADAATLARRLATTDIPATAFAHQVNGQFFSPRLECRIFPPFSYGVDLATLCLPHS